MEIDLFAIETDRAPRKSTFRTRDKGMKHVAAVGFQALNLSSILASELGKWLGFLEVSGDSKAFQIPSKRRL